MFLFVAFALTASIEVVPARFVHRKDKVELSVTLTNEGDLPVTVLTGVAGGENHFFALRLVKDKGKVVWTGDEPQGMSVDDLPAPVFETIPPRAKHRAVLDWRLLYNLAPGRYELSLVYRIDPRSVDVARNYAREINLHHAFVGRIQSRAVEIVVLDKSPP